MIQTLHDDDGKGWMEGDMNRCTFGPNMANRGSGRMGPSAVVIPVNGRHLECFVCFWPFLDHHDDCSPWWVIAWVGMAREVMRCMGWLTLTVDADAVFMGCG